MRHSDIVLLDCDAGILEVEVDAAEFAQRAPASFDHEAHGRGHGRDLFGLFRRHAGHAEHGASARFGDA